jgi:arginyl-tRNA synthetase
MKHFKNKIIKGIKQFIGGFYTDRELEQIIQNTTKPGFGDFSFPCFDLSKKWCYSNPTELAQDIKENVNWDKSLNPEVKKGYINFNVTLDDLITHTLNETSKKEKEYGKNNIGKGKMVVLDYSAPNIGKPLHVGHIRSTILGDSIIKILNFNGYNTWGINYLGDVGLHIGKILVAYDEWGDKKKLKKNPEEEILNLYIDFCKKEKSDEIYTEKAKGIVDRLEKGDKNLERTLKFISDMSMIAFNRVYDLLDVKFDEITGQSKFSDIGKKVVQELLNKSVAYKDENGGIVANLKNHNLPNKAILRSDGTAIYSTQDLGALKYRKETFNFDKLLYVVASEQELYFKQIFKIIESGGYKWAKDCKHINFGMINLKEGKMSTREGQIVYLEEVLNKAIDKAREVIEEKNPTLENKDYTSKIVGVGAIKYMVLGVDYGRNIEFSWDKALNLSGNSATYIQYTHARASSILRKAGKEPTTFKPKDLTNEYETNLIKKIGSFPLVVESAARTFKPHIISNYANELSINFNQFYNKVTVLQSEDKLDSRLCLVKSYKTTVDNAMGLLGIKLPEGM